MPAHAAWPGANGAIVQVGHLTGAAGLQIFSRNPDGSNVVPLTADDGATYAHPRYSSDGNRIAYTRDGNVWTMNANGSSPLQITSGGDDHEPYWSKDGATIFFSTTGHSSDSRIYKIPAGGGAETAAIGAGISDTAPAVSPDGSQLAFRTIDNGSPGDILRVPVGNGGCGCTSLTSTGEDEDHPNWAPGGAEVVYDSNPAANRDVFAISAAGGGTRRPLATTAAAETNPVFSPDGAKIAYQSDTAIVIMDASNGGNKTTVSSAAVTSASEPDWGSGVSGSTGPPVNPACTNPTTLLVTCADAYRLPGICGPTGTIFPACHLPVDLLVVCGGSGTILQTCTSKGPYIVACGGFGTILPQCNLPPPRLPQVCGPKDSILPPCTGANNAVTVCGPSQTILPVCSFASAITVKPLNLTADTGEVDAVIGCPSALATTASRGARAAKSKPKTCSATISLQDLQYALSRALSVEAFNEGENFTLLAQSKPASPVPPDTFTGAQYAAFAKLDWPAYEARARRLIDNYLPVPDSNGKVPSHVLDAVTALLNRAGPPTYHGPDDFILNAVGQGAHSFEQSLSRAVAQYSFLVDRAKQPLRTATATRSSPAISRPRVVKSVKLRRGQRRVRIRLRLSRKVVRSLGRLAGKHARYVPLRVIVSFKAKPRPVARFVDIRVPVKRPPSKRKRKK